MSSLLQLSDLACQAEPIKQIVVEESVNVSASNPAAPKHNGINITTEDRELIRQKLRAAYKKKASTFFELLELCVSVDEELTFLTAPSKLDYYKNGIQNVKRIFEKKSELESGALEAQANSSSEDGGDLNPKSVKRAKTQQL